MSRAEDRKAAYGNGTDVTDVINFTVTNAGSKTNVLPRGFYGQFVRMRPVGANMNFAFSHSASLAVVASPAATDGGSTAATQGEFVPDGEMIEVEVPCAKPDQFVYFSRFGSAAGSVQITKASGKPGGTIVED